MIPVAIRWMHMEERKAVRVDRELDGSWRYRGGRGGRPLPAGGPSVPRRTPSGSVQSERLEGGSVENDGRCRLGSMVGATELGHPTLR